MNFTNKRVLTKFIRKRTKKFKTRIFAKKNLSHSSQSTKKDLRDPLTIITIYFKVPSERVLVFFYSFEKRIRKMIEGSFLIVTM